MLKVNDINVYYGIIHALKGISLEVHEDEIVALIGANGAGKSTTLKTISGLMHSKTGSITLMNEDITHAEAHKLVSKGLAHVPEGRRIFLHMTVLENLEMALIHSPAMLRKALRMFLSVSRALSTAKIRSPARFRAVNSRCSPWAGRL